MAFWEKLERNISRMVNEGAIRREHEGNEMDESGRKIMERNARTNLKAAMVARDRSQDLSDEWCFRLFSILFLRYQVLFFKDILRCLLNYENQFRLSRYSLIAGRTTYEILIDYDYKIDYCGYHSF